MTDDELEAPAYLGRKYPAHPMSPAGVGKPLDPMQVLDLISSDSRRDLSLGYLVMLSALLVLGALAYAGEHWWVLSALCGASGACCSYGAVRRARRRVREEMDLTLREPGTVRRSGSGSPSG